MLQWLSGQWFMFKWDHPNLWNPYVAIGVRLLWVVAALMTVRPFID